MEQVKDILPKAIETLEQPTKVNPISTKAWERFNDFQTLEDPQLETMKYQGWKIVHDIKHDCQPRWLSLLGTSGAGKTMISKIVWHYYRDYFHDRINWTATERTKSENNPNGKIIRHRGGFINWGKAINDRMLKGEYAFLSDLSEWPFFVLDDIASEYQKHRDLSSSKLYHVLESRLGKWTVITANLSLEQISEKLDTRIASRMIRNNSVVVDVYVPDFNLRAPPISS